MTLVETCAGLLFGVLVDLWGFELSGGHPFFGFTIDPLCGLEAIKMGFSKRHVVQKAISSHALGSKSASTPKIGRDTFSEPFRIDC